MTKRLYLIGMPGSGKTTIGRAVAEEMHLTFADMDDVVSKLLDEESISDYFKHHGEKKFRIKEMCAFQIQNIYPYDVVATGGGAVLSAPNGHLMKATGHILMIDRPLEQILSDIDMDARPLLAGNGREKLRNMYARRMPLYRSLAEAIIPNDGELQTTVERVCDWIRQNKKAFEDEK